MNLLNILVITSLSMFVTISLCNTDYRHVYSLDILETQSKIVINAHNKNDFNCLMKMISTDQDLMDEIQREKLNQNECSIIADGFHNKMKNITGIKKCTIHEISLQLLCYVKLNSFILHDFCDLKTMPINRLEKVKDINSTMSNKSVLLTWSESPNYEMCVKQYHLKLNSNYIVVNSKSFLMTMLDPNTSYNVSIHVVHKNGKAGDTTNFNFNTDKEFQRPEFKLSAVSNISNSIFISWNKLDKFLDIKYFEVRCNSTKVKYDLKFSVINNYSLIIQELKPCVKYDITVAAKIFDETNRTIENDLRVKTDVTVIPDATGPPTIKDEYNMSETLFVKPFDTYVSLLIPSLRDLFYCANDSILNYTIIVHRNEVFDALPPIMPTWTESILDRSINAYQATPNQWIPLNSQNHEMFNIGDGKCSVNDNKTYCNGPLKPFTNYIFAIKVCKLNSCVCLRTKTTTQKSKRDKKEPFITDIVTTKGYLEGEYFPFINVVLCTILFIVLVIAIILYIKLLQIVPRTIKNSRMPLKLCTMTKMSDIPFDITYNQLLVKTSREMETEFNLLDVYLISSHSKNVAMEPQNKSKNRYGDILPYDHNRVIINSADNDYINASYIQDSKSVQKYIACQGPMANTCIDMWKMILDHNVTSIVMLCRIFECDKIKCAKYYPNDKESLDFGDIIIFNDEMFVYEERSFTISRLRIVQGNLTKTIHHFQFHDWPDFETPETYSILLEFCLEVQSKSRDGLVVVHCSAGVGRTGTFIACDILLRQIHQNVKKLNVFKTVLSLREQRNSMVQTQAQYNFIYGVVACKIKNLKT